MSLLYCCPHFSILTKNFRSSPFRGHHFGSFGSAALSGPTTLPTTIYATTDFALCRLSLATSERATVAEAATIASPFKLDMLRNVLIINETHLQIW